MNTKINLRLELDMDILATVHEHLDGVTTRGEALGLIGNALSRYDTALTHETFVPG